MVLVVEDGLAQQVLVVRLLVGQLCEVVLLEAVVDGVVLAELGLLAQHLRIPLSHLLSVNTINLISDHRSLCFG